MTTFERLDFETKLDPKPALELFFTSVKITTQVERATLAEGKDIIAWASGGFFHAQARYIEGTPGARAIYARFGFWTNVTMSFEPFKEEYRTLLQNTLISGAFALLGTHDFDLGLAFNNGSHVVMRRNAGRLVLNSLYDIWIPERLAMVTIPYTMEAIP